MSTLTFMRAYQRATQPNPVHGHEHERVWNCTVLVLWPQNTNLVQLEMVRALVKQQGHGARALLWLCQLADRHGCTLTGYIQPTGKLPRLNRMQLRRWYKRHGFTVHRDWWMERQCHAIAQ